MFLCYDYEKKVSDLNTLDLEKKMPEPIWKDLNTWEKTGNFDNLNYSICKVITTSILIYWT